jgi:hypothetical protein
MSDDEMAAMKEVESEGTYERASRYAKILLWPLDFQWWFGLGAYERASHYAKTSLWSFGFLVIGILLFFVLTTAKPENGQSKSLIDDGFIRIIPVITVLVSFLTLVASALGTASTILLGWRAEKRQSEEFKLKIKQLELQLFEAQAKFISPAKDT